MILLTFNAIGITYVERDRVPPYTTAMHELTMPVGPSHMGHRDDL